jgi:hypothetical protein
LHIKPMPDYLAISAITNLFEDEAAEWYQALIEQQAQLHDYAQQVRDGISRDDDPQSMFILSETSYGDVVTDLSAFRQGFVDRWLPAEYASMVLAQFEELRCKDAYLNSVRSFASSFDLGIARLRLLNKTFSDSELTHRVCQALKNATKLLLFLRMREVVVTDMAGNRSTKRADTFYAGVTEGIRIYLAVTPPGPMDAPSNQRTLPWTSTRSQRLNHLGDDESDGGADESDDDSAYDATIAEHHQMEVTEDHICALEAQADSAVGQSDEWMGQCHAMAAGQREELKCFNCYETGHIGRNCSKPITQEYKAFLQKAKERYAQQKAERNSGRGGPSNQGGSRPGAGRGRPDGRGRGAGTR